MASSSSSSGNEKEERAKIVIFLDFDDVLHDTDKESPYADTLHNIRSIHDSGDYILAIASFNNEAHKTLAAWKIRDCFTAMRVGANHAWHMQGRGGIGRGSWKPKYRNEWALSVSKSRQIQSMLRNELSGYNIKDDLDENVADVREQCPGVTAVKVDPSVGFGLHLLPVLL